VALLFKITYESQKKYNWFNKLKPEDKILVRIFSENCECAQEAIVSKESDGKFIMAKLLDDKKCKNCAELNGKNKNGQNTCWYNVTMFTKEDVGKIEKN